MDEDEFDEAYRKRLPALQRAEERLRFLLRDVLTHIEDRRLVRAGPIEVRVKKLPSLRRKAAKHGWTPEQALTEAPDLVGGRIVVNNIEDVHRVEALLRESLSIDTGSVERQDYIDSPTDHGYRALHLNFRINASAHIRYDMVCCEVQIRTRLQDSWAELSHEDIYKQDELPADLRARFSDLASVLAAADQIAGQIRERVQQVITPPARRPRLDRVSAEGIAYIFADTFGRAPPDYVVVEAVRLCDELGVERLENLPDALNRRGLRDKLDAVYREKLPLPLNHETFLLAVLHSLFGDDEQAIAYVRTRAQGEFEEVDAFARRELLAELPATVGELIEDLESTRDDDRIRLYAQALGIDDECACCSTGIIDPYSFAEAATTHYELDDPEATDAADRMQSAIARSGVDVGGLSDSSLCSRCADYMAKSD